MKPFIIVISIIIILVSLLFALTSSLTWGQSKEVDMAAKSLLSPTDKLNIDSSISGIELITDPAAGEVSARLKGRTGGGLGGDAKLDVSRAGSVVTVRAWRDNGLGINFGGRLSLEVVIPASFTGEIKCHSSAGGISTGSDLAVAALDVDTSAGSINLKNVTAQGLIRVHSSAGGVTAGALSCDRAELSSSAGSVGLDVCTANTMKLHSSAGSVRANLLSGAVEADSSAGPVSFALRDVTGNVTATSSAGSVRVGIPAAARADVQLSTSAGRASVNGLELALSESERGKIKGKLGGGGFIVKLHSSAGSVELYGN